MRLAKFSGLFGLFFLIATPAWAWDSVGHRIVAAVAYDQLTPAVKARVDQLTLLLDPKYPPRARFLYISVLPDKWRQQDRQTAGWHFFNTPWTTDNTPLIPAASPNLIAILDVLPQQIAAGKDRQQAKNLAYLVHLLADAHQPLHCSNRFSKALPRGDAGGNLFPLQGNAHNLHAYWDRAAQLLLPQRHYPLSNRQILQLATALEARYPQSSLSQAIGNNQAKAMVAECWQLAKDAAYKITPNSRPGKAYKDLVATVVGQQLALAGYRLAALLNQLFASDAS